MRWMSDPLWCGALEIAKSLSTAHKYIVTPEEFFKFRENFWPLQEAKLLPANEITAFVIEKDKCAFFPEGFWEDTAFQKFHCVFANEVFVAYSAMDEDPVAEAEQIKKHIPAFSEHREEFLREAGSKTARDELPYILDTQKNRILKEMFPNHHYVMEQFEDLSGEPSRLKEAVFKYCVNTINLEISGYCNRNCEYCPVAVTPERKNKNRKVTKELFERCVNDLEKIDYSGIFAFTLFNEPLYDRKTFLDYLRFARKHLPKSYIRISTNGDYLTGDFLQEIAQASATELAVSVHYDGNWSRERQISQINRILDRVGIGNQGTLTEDDGRIIFYVDRAAYDSSVMHTFLLRTEDFKIHGMDRGCLQTDSVRHVRNQDHCRFIMEQLDIAFDGTILPCCSLYYENSDAGPWTYGNMSQFKDIFSVYTSEKAANFRRKMFAPRMDDEYTPDPCQNCSIAYLEDDEKLYRIDDQLRREIYDCWLKK